MVRVYRTPGGHRRFNEDDVRLLLRDDASRGLDLLVDAAVGRTRMESSDGRLQAEPWYQRLDSAARDELRGLGRDLMRLLRRYLEGGDLASPPAEARRLGGRYAALASATGLSIGEAMRAFHLFQEMVAGGIHQLSGLPGQAADLDRQADFFVQEVLIAMVESYTKAER
jgi:hypothetical protein